MSLKLLQTYGSEDEDGSEGEGEDMFKSIAESSKTTTDANNKENGKTSISKTNENARAEAETDDRKKLDIDIETTKKKLPLPVELQNMYPSSSADDKNNEEDNPERHGGRIRSFPHVRGNWASFVHIPVNNSEGVIRQIQTIKQVLPEFPDMGGINFCEDLHLSLSKTVVFRHHWIDSFTSVLKDNLAHIKRFHLVFQNFETYVNEENTRTFIAINIHPSPQLFQLVKASDLALAEYELDTYYADPSFHVSVCWLLGNQSKFLNKSVLPLLNSRWQALCESEPDLQFQLVDAIWFKTGNRMCNFQLNCMQ